MRESQDSFAALVYSPEIQQTIAPGTSHCFTPGEFAHEAFTPPNRSGRRWRPFGNPIGSNLSRQEAADKRRSRLVKSLYAYRRYCDSSWARRFRILRVAQIRSKIRDDLHGIDERIVAELVGAFIENLQRHDLLPNITNCVLTDFLRAPNS